MADHDLAIARVDFLHNKDVEQVIAVPLGNLAVVLSIVVDEADPTLVSLNLSVLHR